jgi:hypothetical protein
VHARLRVGGDLLKALGSVASYLADRLFNLSNDTYAHAHLQKAYSLSSSWKDNVERNTLRRNSRGTMSPLKIPEKEVKLQDFSIKNLGIFVKVLGMILEKGVRFFG